MFEPTEADKPMIVEAAVAAMEELMKMARAGEPCGFKERTIPRNI